MNIAKNMEAIFVAATVLLAATSYAGAAMPARGPAASSALSAGSAGSASALGMQVVVVRARHLRAAEKVTLAE